MKDKYNEFLILIGNKLVDFGYKKDRKKGSFSSKINNKTKKIEFSMKKYGDRGEISVLVSVEYLLLQNLLSKIIQKDLKRKNIFATYICNIPEIHVSNDFIYTIDTNMLFLAEMVIEILNDKVIPYLSNFDNDISVIKMFEYHDRLLCAKYYSSSKLINDYYFIWAGICLLNNFYIEALSILEFIKNKETEKDIEVYILEIKKNFENINQQSSWHLITPQKGLYINPTYEELKDFLFKLDGSLKSFIILENSITQNFIQVAGVSGEFIIELREYYGKKFKHYRFRKRNESYNRRKLLFQGRYISVLDNEITDYNETLKLVLGYLEQKSITNVEDWVEITDYL